MIGSFGLVALKGSHCGHPLSVPAVEATWFPVRPVYGSRSRQILTRATGVAAGLGIMEGDYIYIGQRENWGTEPALFGLRQADRRHWRCRGIDLNYNFVICRERISSLSVEEIHR